VQRQKNGAGKPAEPVVEKKCANFGAIADGVCAPNAKENKQGSANSKGFNSAL